MLIGQQATKEPKEPVRFLWTMAVFRTPPIRPTRTNRAISPRNSTGSTLSSIQRSWTLNPTSDCSSRRGNQTANCFARGLGRGSKEEGPGGPNDFARWAACRDRAIPLARV